MLDVCPWPAARLRRPFPWGKLHWAAGRARRAHAAARAPRAVRTPEACTGAGGSRAQRGDRSETRAAAPFSRFSTGRRTLIGAPSVLVMTWFHPLMDPRGAQNLLRHLSVLDDHAGDAPWGTSVPAFASAPDARPLRERGRLARKSVEYMRSVSRMPAGPPHPGRNGPVRFRQESFVDRDPGDSHDRATREIWWRLAVVGKALREVWARPGAPGRSRSASHRGGPATQGGTGADIRQHAGVSLRAVRARRTPPTHLGWRARCATRWRTPSARDRSRPTRSR